MVSVLSIDSEADDSPIVILSAHLTARDVLSWGSGHDYLVHHADGGGIESEGRKDRPFIYLFQINQLTTPASIKDPASQFP